MLFESFLVILFSLYGLVLFILVARWFLAPFNGSGQALEEASWPEHPEENPQGLIEVINVKKSFERPVLAGISFQVTRGETVGVLGQSGTGKSVLLKLIAGFFKPNSGMVFFDGEEISHLSESKLLEFRKKVSYVFQGGAFFDWLNVRENIAYPLWERGVTDSRQIEDRVDYLLDSVELEGMGDLRYDELSAGAKKQVAIARAIANQPEVILYDEPTTGVDPLIGKSLSRLIRKLDTQENLTSIVVTHDLRCLEIVSDRILLLREGKIYFQGTTEDFKKSEDHFVEAFRLGKRFDPQEVGEHPLAKH